MTEDDAPLALPDVNVLIALVSPDHVHHTAAHAWFTGAGPWATTPFTEAAFVRLLLNPVVIGGDLSLSTALDLLRRLCGQGDHRFVSDGSRLLDTTIDLIAVTGHRQVTDFHLLNLAVTHRATLVTFDGRLARALSPADRSHVRVIPL